MVYHNELVFVNVRIKITHYVYEIFATVKTEKMPGTSQYNLRMQFTPSTQSVNKSRAKHQCPSISMLECEATLQPHVLLIIFTPETSLIVTDSQPSLMQNKNKEVADCIKLDVLK